MSRNTYSSVPDWVDRECWESYVSCAKTPDSPIYRQLRWIDKNILEPFMFKPEVFDWDGVEELVVSLGDKIRKEYDPDAVVGIERGGAIYAKRLAEAMDIDPNDTDNVGKMSVKHYGGGLGWLGHNITTLILPMLFDDAIVEKCPNIEVEGKKVILADDEVASGKTLFAGKSHITMSGAKDVKSATLMGGNNVLTKIVRRGFSLKGADFSAGDACYGIYPWYQVVREDSSYRSF